jgi:hypothetical protein
MDSWTRVWIRIQIQKGDNTAYCINEKAHSTECFSMHGLADEREKMNLLKSCWFSMVEFLSWAGWIQFRSPKLRRLSYSSKDVKHSISNIRVVQIDIRLDKARLFGQTDSATLYF